MKFPILYKYTTLSQIQQWQIIVNGNSYHTEEGLVNGTITRSLPTITHGKNIGKSNETTADTQAIADAKSKHQKQLDSNYNEVLTKDKRFFEPMLAKDWNDEGHKHNFPLLSDPKLDGIRCIIKADGMFTRKGKMIISAPHIFEDLKPLFIEFPNLILDGELYADRSITDFNTIVSCVRKTKPTPHDLKISKNYIQFNIYDIPSYPGNFVERKKYLKTLSLPECCIVVKTTMVFNNEQLDKIFNQYLEEGYEGQMIRTNSAYENKRSRNLLKRKTFFDGEFKIIGVVEGIGTLANKVGTVTIQTEEGIIVNSAINGSHEYLAELWQIRDSLIGKMATVKYFEKTPYMYDIQGNITGGGSLRFPKVIQIDRMD